MFITTCRKARHSSLYELNQSIPHPPILFKKFQYLPSICAHAASLIEEELDNIKLTEGNTVRKDSPEGQTRVNFYRKGRERD
jgi:hypothetical protein